MTEGNKKRQFEIKKFVVFPQKKFSVYNENSVISFTEKRNNFFREKAINRLIKNGIFSYGIKS